MATPCALFASCCQTLKPKQIVQEILPTNELSETNNLLEGITAYPWHIDTKYYTADINLCATEIRTIGDENFADSVQAVILCFDSEQTDSFEEVKSWLPYLKEIEPQVQLLLCNRCHGESGLSREAAWKWCLEESFELVELDPEIESETEDDDFQETTGIQRVVQALQAHSWPNLVMKDRPTIRSAYFQQVMREEAATIKASAAALESDKSAASANEATSNVADDNSAGAEAATATEASSGVVDTECHKQSQLENNLGSISDSEKLSCANCAPKEAAQSQNASDPQVTNKTDDSKQAEKQLSSQQIIDSIVIPDEDSQLLEALGREDPDGESFESLFENLRVMKERAQMLPPEQRKVYAEQIAVQFWRAIGGDEGEIAGLSDSSDD